MLSFTQDLFVTILFYVFSISMFLICTNLCLIVLVLGFLYTYRFKKSLVNAILFSLIWSFLIYLTFSFVQFCVSQYFLHGYDLITVIRFIVCGDDVTTLRARFDVDAVDSGLLLYSIGGEDFDLDNDQMIDFLLSK